MKTMLVGSGLLWMGLTAGCQAGEPTSSADGVASQAAALKGTEVFHSSWNGVSASASMGDELTWASVDVWEDNENGQHSVYLSYYIRRADPNSYVCEDSCDPWSCGGGGGGSDAGGGAAFAMPNDGGDCAPECKYTSCYYGSYVTEYGWGEIPADAFHGSPNKAKLATTIDTGSGFYVERCTSTQSDYTCTTGEADSTSIQISWQRDGTYTRSSTGVTKEAYSSYTYQTHGSYSESTARATGNLGDVAFTGEAGNGWLSVNRGGSVEKSVLVGGGGSDGGVSAGDGGVAASDGGIILP